MGVAGLCEEKLQGMAPAVFRPDLRQTAPEDTLVVTRTSEF
jgi:hypothetical protein